MDNSKLNYDSEWDIDQLDSSGQVNGITLPANTLSLTSVTLAALSLDYPPVVDGVFQLSSDTVWRQYGDSSSVTLVNLPTFLSSTQSGIFLSYYNFNGSDVVVNARYYTWTDSIIQ